LTVETSPMKGQVIFVEGAPRSGTTLLVSMLATHPKVAGIVAESHLFDQGIDRLFDNLERDAQYEGFLSNYTTAPELTDLARDLCDGVLGGMRDRVKPEATRVLEKTPAPRNGAHKLMLRKLAIYPDATYVHVVRKREGVVKSLRRAPWADVTDAEAGEWWQQAVEGIRDACSEAGAAYLELAYEDLAADPVAVVEGLLGSLGLDVDDEVRSRLEATSRERISTFGPAPAPGGAADVSGGRGIVADQPDRRAKAVSLLKRALPTSGPQQASLAQELIVAARRRDMEEVERLTHPGFTFDLRSGAGDLVTSGDAARGALLAVIADIFRAQGVTERWSGADDGTITTVMYAATHGDGKRLDIVFAATADAGRVTRLALLSVGDPGGRQPTEWAPPDPP
jgi:hypothetical protein